MYSWNYVLFLIFISDLPGGISCQLVIYTDDTITCSCFNSKYGRFIKVGDLENNIQTGANWGKKRFVNSNAFKKKLLSFTHQR